MQCGKIIKSRFESLSSLAQDASTVFRNTKQEGCCYIRFKDFHLLIKFNKAVLLCISLLPWPALHFCPLFFKLFFCISVVLDGLDLQNYIINTYYSASKIFIVKGSSNLHTLSFSWAISREYSALSWFIVRELLSLSSESSLELKSGCSVLVAVHLFNLVVMFLLISL